MVFAALAGRAQPTASAADLRFQNFDRRNGLESLGFFNVVRDSSGFIWLSGNGITRFDGRETRHYAKGAGQHPLLQGYTDNLVVDRNGVLWIGGAGGLCYYDPSIDGFRYIEPPPAGRIQFAYAFAFDGKETIWFSSNLGLCNINTRTHAVLVSKMSGYTNPMAALIDHLGRIWVGTAYDGIRVYNPRNGAMRTLRVPEPDGRPAAVPAMTIDARHQVWIAKSKGMVRADADAVKDAEDSSFVFSELPALRMVEVAGFATLPSYSGTEVRWIATAKGLLRFDTQSGTLQGAYTPMAENPFSIASAGVNGVYADGDGQLWATTIKGLSLMNPASQNFKSRIITSLTQKPDPYILDIGQDRNDTDIVWIGTRGAGLLQYNWKRKKMLRSFEQFDAINEGGYGVNTVVDDGKGRVWFGFRNRIYCLDKKSGTIRQFPLLPTEKNFSYRNVIRKIICVRDVLAIASSTGLVTYDPQSGQYAVVYSGGTSSDINRYNLMSVVAESDSILWCGSKCGLTRINLSSGAWTAFTGPKAPTGLPFFNGVNYLASDGERLLLATVTDMLEFNKRTLRARPLPLPPGTPNSDVRCVLLDSLNNYWFNSAEGIVYVNRAKRNFRVFTSSEGLENDVSDVPLQWIGHQIVFKGRSSITHIDPYSVENNRHVPQPVITAFRILENPRPFDPASVGIKEMELDHRENFLSFDFTAFEFNFPDKVRFAYRMSGFNEEWISSGTKRSATFTNLPPGHYVFEMKAANSEGLWSKPVRFQIYIQPAFWQTLAFRGLLVLLVLGLLYALYRYRINQLLKLQRVRNRISADLHDDIGSAISAVRISNAMAMRRSQESGQVAPLLAAMGEDLKKMGESLDDIVWNINTPASDWKDLLARMRRYAGQILENSAIPYALHFDEPQQLPSLSLECRRDLFLIFKETVNNAARHSGATMVTIQTHFNAGHIVLEVTDNGAGFDPLAPSSRNGLKNMRQRAAHCKADFRIKSAPGLGTQVLLTMKITQKS